MVGLHDNCGVMMMIGSWNYMTDNAGYTRRASHNMGQLAHHITIDQSVPGMLRVGSIFLMRGMICGHVSVLQCSCFENLLP